MRENTPFTQNRVSHTENLMREARNNIALFQTQSVLEGGENMPLEYSESLKSSRLIQSN